MCFHHWLRVECRNQKITHVEKMEEATKLPGFATISKAIELLNIETPAAEMHGLLTALFCGGAKLRQEAWLNSMFSAEQAEEGDIIRAEARDALIAVYQVTANCFAESEHDFNLLLPEEDSEFHLKVEALAEWCQGFLTGLSLVGIDVQGKQAGDLQEAFDDLMKISCLRYEEDELSDEESEAAYTELVEYARVAVLLIYNSTDELLRDKVEVSGNDTLH